LLGLWLGNPREGGVMAKCGICGQRYGDLLVRHADLCEDDVKAKAQPYAPELDDLIKQLEEGEDNA